MTAKPDWEAIERAYRAGSLSIRAIGELHGANHATILKRAKKNGWERDLTEQVRAATQRKVTTSVTSGANKDPLVTEAEIVAEASDQALALVLSHRASLAVWHGIADKLSTFLIEADVTDKNHGDFARSLNAGVDAQLKVIKGQRQAFNLADDNGEGGNSADQSLTISFVKPNGN
ncbi:hypothetical protein [Pseudomonas sp. C9]|uniref:hypothetical protein n=1 Tax=Pseudomonas sp. C9 TaxID=1311337 RepID=UPI000984C361|nr:hypothetical protein [Pseudomonas sp. C9]OOG11292.1 hypothetical protein BMS17_04020 [Pseudomonas sp. C9]